MSIDGAVQLTMYFNIKTNEFFEEISVNHSFLIIFASLYDELTNVRSDIDYLYVRFASGIPT